MPNCVVYCCTNTNWKTNGTNDQINLKTSTIYSTHFGEECFVRSLRHKFLNYLPSNAQNLKMDDVPTINILKCRRITEGSVQGKEIQKKNKPKILARNVAKSYNEYLHPVKFDPCFQDKDFCVVQVRPYQLLFH
ncbi:hypothetical protein PR048_009371 [Dryococelus australis]|uniref:Uncharacterized protein n=1 Tax=Dryococelus australis TaxID=614101 RepID=A0ABQ9I0E9_9NEOP|nr:hypothetical protein PR048_009371 [Dryococelus australis]